MSEVMLNADVILIYYVTSGKGLTLRVGYRGPCSDA